MVKSVLVGWMTFWSADSPGLLILRILIKAVYFLPWISSFVKADYLSGKVSGNGELSVGLDFFVLRVVFDCVSIERSRRQSPFEEVVVLAHLLAYCN